MYENLILEWFHIHIFNKYSKTYSVYRFLKHIKINKIRLQCYQYLLLNLLVDFGS